MEEHAIARLKPFRSDEKGHVVNSRDAALHDERTKVVLSVDCFGPDPSRGQRERNEAPIAAKTAGRVNPFKASVRNFGRLRRVRNEDDPNVRINLREARQEAGPIGAVASCGTEGKARVDRDRRRIQV